MYCVDLHRCRRIIPAQRYFQDIVTNIDKKSRILHAAPPSEAFINLGALPVHKWLSEQRRCHFTLQVPGLCKSDILCCSDALHLCFPCQDSSVLEAVLLSVSLPNRKETLNYNCCNIRDMTHEYKKHAAVLYLGYQLFDSGT